jgi:8-oxo-dGTP diphosphatase
VTDAPRRRLSRVAAYALCVDDDEILLSRIAPSATADATGKWTLPGGGVEFREDPRDTAVRELEEETGLRGEIVELLTVQSLAGTFTDPTDAVETDYHGIRVIYRVRILGGDLRDEVDGSTDASAWVPRSDLVSMPLTELAEVGIGLAFHNP